MRRGGLFDSRGRLSYGMYPARTICSRDQLKRRSSLMMLWFGRAVAFYSLSGVINPGQASPISIASFAQLALQCGPTVAPLTLASIAQTESRFQPLTISDNTVAETAIPTSLPEAASIATQLINAGHSVDVGIMQINSANFGLLGLTTTTALDPCHSIAAAARLLTNDYTGGATHAAQQTALRDALSEYNTGDPLRGYENGYVHKVELASRTVVPAIDPGLATMAARPTALSMPPRTAMAVTPASWNVWANVDGKSAKHDDSAIFTDSGDGSAASVLATGPSSER